MRQPALRSVGISLLAGCMTALPPSATPEPEPARAHLPLEPGEVAVGEPGRSRVVGGSIARRWLVLLQARADTDGDGVVCSRSDGHHGFELADRPTSWLVLGAGPGEAIDELHGATADDRFVVFSQQGDVVVLDLDTGERTRLGPRTAPTRWIHSEPGESASVSWDAIVHRRSASEATVFDPYTGTSTHHPIPTGWLFRAHVAGDWLLAEVLDAAPADPSSTSALPHMESSAGDLPCSLASGRCFGPEGHLVLFRLGEPDRPIDAGREGVTVASWGFVRGDDDGALVLVRHPSGRATQISDAGCDGQLLTLGEPLRYVAYRCEPDRAPRVLLFSDDELAPPTDETARLAGGDEAWIALGATREEAAHLSALLDTSSTFHLGGDAAALVPMREPLADDAIHHHVVPRCDEPTTPYLREAASFCARVGPDVEIIAALRDGRALARIRRGPETPRCDGDDTQLVWTEVTLETLR